MNRIVSIALTLTLSLWAGSLVHLVLTVSSLFASFPKAQSSVALQAAPAVFWITERYHIALCLIVLLLLLAWSRLRRSRWILGMGVLAVLASVLVFVQAFGLSAKMEALRGQGLSGGPEFTRLHRLSSTQYMIQAALVLASLALLPAAIAGRDNLSASGTTQGPPRA